jgi:Zn-dependent protease with chaperone function
LKLASSAAAHPAHTRAVAPARPAGAEPLWSARRAFVLAGASVAALPALAQVDVGKSSTLRKLVPAEELEGAAQQQYAQMMSEAQTQKALLPASHPQVQRLRRMARRMVPFATAWNDRAAQWQWEVNLIRSPQVNAFCMPGGKIAFYTGILDQLKLNDDEAAMVMGHEMAHALREHARERMAKSGATNLGLRLGAQLLGLGELGDAAAGLGTQLLSLKFSREDESEADLVGLDLAARSAYKPQASVSLWQKMTAASGGAGPGFLSTHPSGPNRIRELQANVPKVQRLYEAARRG